MPKVKTEKKTTIKKKVAKVGKRSAGLSVPMFTLEGKKDGVLELPKDLFGTKLNRRLLNQAVRVYLNNLKAHFSHTKTRSEVKGSTAKIRAQKGTGGARHGSKRAPIFVGGGIALGPKYRKVSLKLPNKMKKTAFLSALSSKFQTDEVVGIKGLEEASGKTRQIQSFLKSLGKKEALFLVGNQNEKAAQAVRNLSGVGIRYSDQLNILDILRYPTLILTEDALGKLEFKVKKDKKV